MTGTFAGALKARGIDPTKREAADRALATHHRSCPVSRGIEAGIEITTSWG